MTDDFAIASRVAPIGEGLFRADIPDGWQQGKGAFGGLAIGVAIRAMEAIETERHLRALTAELPGPLLPGPADVHATVLRRGSGASTLDARIVQGGEVKVRASGVFGAARAEDVRVDHRIDIASTWREVPPLTSNLLPPPFARFFEYRPKGPAPFSGAAEPHVEGWTRPLVPLERWGPAEVAAMADAYWPSLFGVMRTPRPMATITYTLQLTAKAYDLDASAPLYYRARTLVADAGYLSELRELFTPEGELVALNPQTFVVIK